MQQKTRYARTLFGFTLLGLVGLSSYAHAADPDKRPLTQEAVSNAKMMVRADLDMQKVLNTFATLDPKAIEKLTPAEARKEPTIADAVNKVLAADGPTANPALLVPGVIARDQLVGGAKEDLLARIYTPEGQGPFPVIVYFHGGGWVIADRIVYDGGARALAKKANAIVISPDYRLAPEHKFPAAHEDAIAVYKWAAEHAASLGGDPQRLALAGESAGGNLAVATTIAARDKGLTKPLHVLSIYPVAQNSTTTATYQQYADAKPLNRPMMLWFIANATGSAADLKDPRLNLVAANLAGLPPVTIINAEIDPLRDDGQMLETALKKNGISVERKVYEGVTHEFFGTAPVVQKAVDAQDYAGQRLQAAFKK